MSEQPHTHADGTAHTHGDGHGHTHSHAHTKAVLNRLSRAQGHLDAVRRMVERGEDCSAVLVQLSAVISRKATGEDLLFAPAAAGKQRLCMKPRAGQKQYGTKQPAGVGARPFESIFYGSVLSILRASAANSGSIVRRLCDFSSPISSCISVIDFPCARR